MELRHLRYFTMVAKELSFTRAAKKLHISQPPLSMQIQQLEEELGVQLLVRDTRNITLTAAGQAFLDESLAILAQVEEASTRARAIMNGLAGNIEVSLSDSHFEGPFCDFIARYLRLRPEVVVTLHELSPSEQLIRLRNRRIDISISRTPVDDKTLHSTRLWKDPLIVALPHAHPLGACQSLSIKQLADEPMVMLRRDSSAYARYIYECCVQCGFSPRMALTVTEFPNVVNLVAANVGLALVPKSLSGTHRDKVTYVPLDDTPVSDVYMVTRKNELSSTVRNFGSLLKEYAAHQRQ